MVDYQLLRSPATAARGRKRPHPGIADRVKVAHDETMRIVAVAFDNFQSLDLVGPLEVFSLADRELGGGAYELEIVAGDGSAIRTSSGITIQPDRSLGDCGGDVDTLIVAGGTGTRQALADDALIAWIRAAAARSRRVTSVCTGAFLLAAAGLLEGRSVTTHWSMCEVLGRVHPGVDVDPAPIFIRDGNVYTSAGVTAGIDLALALVEEDHGRELALRVARDLVLFVRRPGGQAQFSATLAGQRAERDSVRELQAWIVDHLDDDLTVPALASRAAMSPRNFARVFAREVGTTPAAYVTAIRVERARVLLETTDLQVDEVARRCGFGTVETLRRSFGRRLNGEYGDYRERFAA
jgi:transcriptional regulator GlxA family with amidase domain